MFIRPLTRLFSQSQKFKISTLRFALAIICLALVSTVSILAGSFHTRAGASSTHAAKTLIPLNSDYAVAKVGGRKKSPVIAGSLLEFMTGSGAETNSPPVAVADGYTIHGITPLTPSVLANDYDPDGDSFQFYSYGSYPQHGSLAGSSGSPPYSFAPHFGYTGTDSFSYRICDGFGACSSFATVLLNINNSPPVADPDAFTIDGTTQLPSVLANDYDPDGD